MNIKIDLKIFLFAFLFYITKQNEIYALVMLFAFVHELGHLLFGLALGFKIDSIKINPLGFRLSFQSYVEDYNQKIKNGNLLCIKKIWIALAGPLTNIIMILLLGISHLPNTTTMIYANLLLAIFNLLPIYPLDGGRILEQVIHIIKGKEAAYYVISSVGRATVILLTIATSILILYIHNIAFVLILIYLWYLVIQNEKIIRIKQSIYKEVHQSEILK